MASSVPHGTARADSSPFDITRPSPLPSVPPRDPDAVDPVERAEQDIARLDAQGAPAADRVHACLALADAWLSLDATGPALDAVRRAVAASRDHPEALERFAALAARVGSHREAAEARESLGRVVDTAAAWEAAVQTWLRAGELEDAERALKELLRCAGDAPRTRSLELNVLRLRGGATGTLVARLLDAAVRARRHDDREGWRVHAADAWLESRGAEGGEILTEALAASGRPRASVYVAAEAAARALPVDGRVTDTTARLLVRCARLAENAAMPGEATAAWTVCALLGDAQSHDARESLRDLLAERGRAVDLAARLRADARRSPVASRAAAWKGVAAIEIPHEPSRAAYALAEALRVQPDDVEATELLDALATNPAAEEAVCDALWGLVGGASVDASVRTRWLSWLGELEERAGDTASAEVAYALAGEPAAEALARVAGAAESLRTRAGLALDALESADHGAESSAEHLLASFGRTPGAFHGHRSAGRVLGSMALHDGRVADLWVRVARRSDESGQLLTVLRRVATRCTAPSARVAAAIECAETLDATEGPTVAAEILAQLLDELPEEPAAAAALAALAEHADDPSLSRDALRSIARAATDPWERDLLTRFTGGMQGIFAVFASCLAEPTVNRDRTTNLARLHDLLGDCTALFAGRTRALLARTGPGDEGLDVARRFATFDPSSPEATIAWFGAASLAGEPDQLTAAASAVAGSLASVRDLAAVARTALARLGALGAERQARDVALAVTRAGALFDRPLRAAVTELAEASSDVATGLRLMESVAASAQASPAEQESALRRIAGWYRHGAHAVGELRALERVLALCPGDAAVSARVVELSARVGDGAAGCKLLETRLAEGTAPADRRTLLLARATALANSQPSRIDEAVAALDRYVFEARSDTAQGEAVRALIALGRADLAVDRLARWATEALSDQGAAVRAMAGAQVAHEVLHDPTRALGILRSVLGRASNVPEVLLMAERIAVEAQARTAMVGIYDDLTVTAAGDHGRHALAYRRAAYLERVGDHAGALAAHVTLFERAPSLGASFTAIERIVESTGSYDVLTRCLGALAAAATQPETRARYYLRAAEVARTRGRDLRAATGYELEALRAQPDTATDALVVEHARLLRASDPEGAREIFNALTDDALAAGNLAWEDENQQAFALRAAELAASEASDPYRLAASVALYLRGHEDLAAGRDVITSLLNRTAASRELRDAAESVPAMATSLRASEASPTPVEASRPRLELVALASDHPALTQPAEDLDAHSFISLIPDPPEEPAQPKASSVPETMSAADLREAAGRGNDTAAAALAERLATSEDSRDEALAIQRRRLAEDPARIDALTAMVSLYEAMQMPAEAEAVGDVLAVLVGKASTVHSPALHDLVEPLDGVARLLTPASLAPWMEFGALVWDARGTPWRREVPRAGRESDRPWVDPSSEIARLMNAALRLLQLPRSTPWTIHDEVQGGVQVTSTHPAGIVVSVPLARDTPRARYLIGRGLEGTRPGNVLTAVLDNVEGERLLAAVQAAFGELSEGIRVDASVARLATLLQDGIPSKAQRRVRDLVDELGSAFTWASWCKAAAIARSRAGMLLAGDFGVAAMEVLATDATADADARKAIVTHEPLRDLARFATSKEYLLLRWQVDETSRWRR